MFSSSAVPPGRAQRSSLGGVAVALLIPRHSGGELDLAGHERQLRFLLERGVGSFVLNGATGEYIRSSEAELLTLIHLTRALIGTMPLTVGVGSPTASGSRAWAALAQNEGADGILLPMPYFFPYGQEDLVSFAGAVLPDCRLPVYLYNLPSFTTPLEAETVVELLEAWPRLRGVKDSSGTTEILSAVRSRTPDATCIVGNDASLHGALSQGVCDGIVSGVCCVLPELMTVLYAAAAAAPNAEEALRLNRALTEFVGWLERFPVPWGLRMIAEARGVSAGSYPMPLAAGREAAQRQFVAWFEANRERLLAVDDGVKV